MKKSNITATMVTRPSIVDLYNQRTQIGLAITNNHEVFLAESRRLNKVLDAAENEYKKEILNAVKMNQGKTARDIAKTLTNEEWMQDKIVNFIANYASYYIKGCIGRDKKEFTRHYAELDEEGNIVKTFDKTEIKNVYFYKS